MLYSDAHIWFYRLQTLLMLTTGTMLLMWLGEQITERGVGNGMSLLIFSGIVVGLPRGVAETPYEFLPRLTHQFPEQTEDIHSITEAYVAVHYGEENVALDVVARVRAAWERVETVIRTAKKR